jgi:hypothetical protein
VHAAQPSETNEYSILAGKTLGKYMLGKYTRNASAKITGLDARKQITKIQSNNWVGAAQTEVWSKTATMFVSAYKYQ